MGLALGRGRRPRPCAPRDRRRRRRRGQGGEKEACQGRDRQDESRRVRQWHRRFAKKKAKESELERAQIAREQQQSISARMEKSFVSLASAFTTFDDAGRKEQESFDRSPPEEQARREGPSSGRGLLLDRAPHSCRRAARNVELHVRTAFAQPSPCCLKKLHAPPNPPITRTRLLHRSAARQPPTSTARRRIPHPAMYPALKGCSRRPSRARRSTQ